ncbi:MAG: PEGA domain-containing protein [Candidatus Paceibacterota bacterium]
MFQRGEENGVISITPTGQKASVFINRSSMKPLQSTSSPTTYEVSSGSHQVLVAQDNYWPWSQQITIGPGETIGIEPFLIEQSSRQVLQTTEEIRSNLMAARDEPIPSQESPLLSENEDIRVYVDGETNIIAQWNRSTSTAPDFFHCHEDTCGVSVFNQLSINQIEFYPGRDDVIFFATPSGVFAMEINPSGETQNFQPVVESVRNPSFTTSDGNIFVLYGDRITVSDI